MSTLVLTLDDIRYEHPTITLHAVRVATRGWNGFAVPVASAAEFTRFIAAHHHNDPNGTWSPEGVREGDGALIYEDEMGVDVWIVVDIVDGSAVYELSGWQWSELAL